MTTVYDSPTLTSEAGAVAPSARWVTPAGASLVIPVLPMAFTPVSPFRD